MKMKKIAKALAASAAAAAMLVYLALPAYAYDNGSLKQVGINDISGIETDAYPTITRGYTLGSSRCEECLVIGSNEQLTVMSGTKLTVSGLLVVQGSLFIERGGALLMQGGDFGTLAVDGGSVVSDGLIYIKDGHIEVTNGGTFCCTPDSTLRIRRISSDLKSTLLFEQGVSNTVILGKLSESGESGYKPPTVISAVRTTKTTDGSISAPERLSAEQLYEIFPRTEKLFSGKYIPIDSELSFTSLFFDNGASITLSECSAGVYRIGAVSVNQPHCAGEIPELNEIDSARYVFMGGAARFTEGTDGTVTWLDKPDGTLQKYVENTENLKLIPGGGMWCGNPRARLYRVGGDILWVSPVSMESYKPQTMYEACIYKKRA